MPSAYSVTDVASLLGLSVAEVRRCVRAGFLSPVPGEPPDEPRLTFQDLVSLRQAAKLFSSRVRPHRVRHALRRLREQLPEGQPLSSVSVTTEGRQVMARDGGHLWAPSSGQMHFSFEAPPTPVKLLAVPESAPARLDTAEQSYLDGCELEETSPVDAERAYRHALELVPGHREAGINLGRLLHELGRLEESVRAYRTVLESGPSALACFNLGVCYEDLGQDPAAHSAYQSAIAADPDFADAYFNLSRVCERRGDRANALRALRAYRDLSRTSS